MDNAELSLELGDFQLFQPKARESGEEGVVLIKEYLGKCHPNINPNQGFISFLRSDSTHATDYQGDNQQKLFLPHTHSLSLQGPLSNEEFGVMVECLSSLAWKKPIGLCLSGALSLSVHHTPFFRWLGSFQFCMKELVLSSTQLTDAVCYFSSFPFSSCVVLIFSHRLSKSYSKRWNTQEPSNISTSLKISSPMNVLLISPPF